MHAKKDIPTKNKISPEKHIKIEPFRKGTLVTPPHKHKQYFEIIFLSRGSGHHRIDGQRYEVKPPVFFFLNREQVHNWELDNEPEGYVIIFKNTFLQHSRDESLKQLLPLIWHANCLYLEEARDLESLFALLTTYSIAPSVYEYHSIDGLLKALIALLLEKGRHVFLHTGIQPQLYARYVDLLLTLPNIQRKIGVLARQLGSTPQNLNAACRKAVGQSASEVLNRHIIGEARRLLLYTDNNINEIAYQLSFKDPSYFIKFFKHREQATPEEFRKLHFQDHHQ
ncbi:MAG TPA: helix-turn-helix transcriptional regulator [Puia sp.]|nr:helix-turn-helix transcriptional regulator [Puia sp.]